MARRPPRKSSTSRIIEALFDEPPVNEAELELRLLAADEAEAQRLLVRRLREGRVGVQEGALYIAAFSVVGVGDEGAELLEMAADRDRAPHERAFAVAVLSSDDPDQLQELAQQLDPVQAEALAEASVLDLLVGIEAEPERSEAVAGALSALPASMRGELLDQLETGRFHLGCSAAVVYAQALAAPDLSTLRRRMLDAVLSEDGMEGIALLERLRDDASDDKARRDYQAALLRARTQSIDPRHEARVPEGFAYVGSCDGQAAYLVIGLFDNPDGSLTLADLCIRASADVRDGFVVRRQSAEDLDEVLFELRSSSGSGFVRVPLPLAAELVAEAVDRTRAMGRALPRDALSAIAMFDRARRTAMGGLPPLPEPRKRSTRVAVRGLLERPEHASTWFFDEGDLSGAGIELPTRRRPVRAWLDAAAARLDTPAVRRRVLAMAEHMARWHGWNDDPDRASLCAALARETEASFRTSNLVLALLERSLRLVEGPRRPLVVALADPTARQHLKALFFRDVQVPTGRHLARLDMTEAAFLSLDQAFDTLPGDRRPREDDRNTAAHAIGCEFADFVIAGAKGPQPIEPLAERVVELLELHCELTEDEAEQVTPIVLTTLGSFVSTVCAHCPVSCLVQPDTELSEPFFRPLHPMTPA